MCVVQANVLCQRLGRVSLDWSISVAMVQTLGVPFAQTGSLSTHSSPDVSKEKMSGGSSDEWQ